MTFHGLFTCQFFVKGLVQTFPVWILIIFTNPHFLTNLRIHMFKKI